MDPDPYAHSVASSAADTFPNSHRRRALGSKRRERESRCKSRFQQLRDRARTTAESVPRSSSSAAASASAASTTTTRFTAVQRNSFLLSSLSLCNVTRGAEEKEGGREKWAKSPSLLSSRRRRRRRRHRSRHMWGFLSSIDTGLVTAAATTSLV